MSLFAIIKKRCQDAYDGLSQQHFLLILIGLSLLIPLVLKNQYWLYIAVQTMVYALLALGLNAIIYCGLLDLGYIAFFAIGAYSYAILNTWYGLSFWAVLPITIFLSFCSGLTLAFVSLRSRSDYFALLTLAFGEVVRLFIRNSDTLTNGPQGIMGIAKPQFIKTIESPRQFYYFALVWLICLLYVLHKTSVSRLGAAWAAVRQNENWLISTGYNTLTVRIAACIMGALFAGIGGSFFAAWQTFVAPESFTFFESIFVLCMVILGAGTNGNIAGVLLGAFILALLPELSRSLQEYRMLAVGAGMTAIVVLRPRGLVKTSWESQADSSLFRSIAKCKDSDKTQINSTTQSFDELRIVSLKKSFGGVKALGMNSDSDVGFTFTFKKNNIYGIIGLNGAGKTTLLNCIRGFVVPDDGTVTLNNVSLFRGRSYDENRWTNRIASIFKPQSVRRLAFRNAEYVASTFQTCSILEEIPAWKNVYLAQKPLRGPFDVISELADSILGCGRSERIRLKDQAKDFLIESLDFQEGDLERPLAELPFAKRRLVEVAKAFATNRPVILLDEPTAGLNEVEQIQLATTIKQLAKGKIVIVIEHNYRLLRDLTNIVVFMEHGQIGNESGVVIAGDYDYVMSRDVVRQTYIGTTLDSPRPLPTVIRTPPALEMKIRRAGYSSGASVLRGIDITVPRRTITALLGPNGSGKSTLLRCIMNSPEVQSMEASIRFYGNGSPTTLVEYRRERSLPTYAIAQSGVILLRQENKLFDSMTVKENLEFGLSIASREREQRMTHTIAWFLDTIFLPAFGSTPYCDKKRLLSRRATELSGGQQQLLALGRALLACGFNSDHTQNDHPNFMILLDEPVTGLQPSLVRLVLKTIYDLKEQYGITFLIAEQSDLVKNFADSILRIENGE